MKISRTADSMGRLTFDPIKTADYTVRPAKYAKGKVAVETPSTNDLKTRAARIMSAIAQNYSRREHAYIVSPRQAEKFLEAFHSGKDGALGDVRGRLGWVIE